MNFSVSGGFGVLGGWILFGVLMIAFTVVVTFILRVVRGREDRPADPAERSSEDNFIL